MTERRLGIAVSGDKVVVVDAEVSNDTDVITVHGDFAISLQKGDRAVAYTVIAKRISDYAREKGISRAVVKDSAVSMAGTKLAHLRSAELRGVVICALSTVCRTCTLSKAHISRTFGERKADEYVRDNDFWANRVVGELKTGSREAALCVLADNK